MAKRDPYKNREAKKYENPIASREYILELLTKIAEPVSFKRLAKTLNFDEPREREALRRRLGAMVRDGQLAVDSRNVYGLAEKLELITGRITAHPDGYGFLIRPDDEDVFLTRRQMSQVFHGDFASVRIRGTDRRGRPEGEILEVVERHTEQIVGRFYEQRGMNWLEPLNRRINHEIMLETVEGDGFEAHKAGQIIVAKVTEQPSKHGVVKAQTIEVLGDHLTPDIEVEVALRGNDIPSEWSEEVLAVVEAMPSEVKTADKRNRFDLTEIPFVTIDGEDARDFDDAVFCEAKDGGGWRLYVAIADVAHYVEPDTILNDSAYERSTSVYFPQFVVPMLPEKLSNGLCSLNPEVERLVMVCEMTISAKGKISGYEFYEGFIHSHARLTYTRVAEILTGETESDEALEDLIPYLYELNNLYKVLQTTRKTRGAIEFETTELGFEFDDAGKVVGITPRERNDAHKIIEECMLCANVCAAKFVTKHKKPGLFRVHEPPAVEKVEGLVSFLASFGIQFQFSAPVAPHDYQKAVGELRSQKNGQILQMALLRSMNQAVYQPDNLGHFGLGYEEYTHFTSPIRRYPDLLTHRLIKSVIHSKMETKHVARLGKPSKKSFYPYDMEQVLTLGAHTSMAERRAESAVYEVLEWSKCDYISGRVGDEFDGQITGVTKFGFFVELADVFVEGLVHVSTLTNDYFTYEPETQTLASERSKKRFRMGDSVKVQLAKVDVDERKVDLELVAHESQPYIGSRVSKGGAKNSNRDGGSKPKRRSGKKRERRRPRGAGDVGASKPEENSSAVKSAKPVEGSKSSEGSAAATGSKPKRNNAKRGQRRAQASAEDGTKPKKKGKNRASRRRAK